MLSIDAGINHNGANNALLLAAGYLNDLYMMVGNDAYADAFNPTRLALVRQMESLAKYQRPYFRSRVNWPLCLMRN